jgi:sigma-B regulation protein RsbU (phosphoserine phosphatase)
VPPVLDPSAEALELLDLAACGLLQTSEDGTFLRANRTFCKWVGYTAEELVGRRRFQDLLTMGGRIFHQTHWTPLLRMQGSVSEVKLDFVHRDGSSLPMVLNALRHEHEGGIVLEIAAYVARDRDKYERELVQSRKRLEDLVAEATRHQAEAKDRAVFAEQMIGIVSHDLRNPLSGISMGVALLARGELSPPQQRTLGRISRSTERANRLIGDLLDFTQARLGRGLAISPELIDLHEAVCEAVDELSSVYPARPLNQVRSGEGACWADANRLAQLVGNLVSNAMTYGTPDTPVTVTSTIEPASFSVAVSNRGQPIPEEVQTRIFQPMTRGTTAGSAGRSVGLGLFIVSEIARAHGGKASVRSTLDEGTTFSAVFPRTAAV